MARMPGVIWEPVTNHTDGPFREPILGIVLHVNAAESYDLHNFFQASSGAGSVSSHFQVAKDGTVWQYIDTSETAWCQGDGNAQYLSIESEGLADEPATAAQIASIARILQFVHAAHGIPYQLAERPGDRGLGWHGMGAAAGDPNWGHALCPGVRKDQRAAMLAAANPPAPTPAPSHPNRKKKTCQTSCTPSTKPRCPRASTGPACSSASPTATTSTSRDPSRPRRTTWPRSSR